jgi:hypothetical protein
VREQLSIRGRSVYFADFPIKVNQNKATLPHRDFVPWLLVRAFVQHLVVTNYNRQYHEVCSATDNQAPAEFLGPPGSLLLFGTSLRSNKVSK